MSALSWGDVAEMVVAVVAVFGAIQGWHNSRQINEVHLSINSRMDQLLRASEAAAHAAGVDQERSSRETK
jgi:hypothetical protein